MTIIAVVAFTVRVFRISDSYDLFIDEPFYTQVGQSVSNGHLPYATGSLFFLHPPGFFLVEALWMNIFGAHSDVFAQVYSVRKLVAVFAALSVVLVVLIVDKISTRPAALTAGFLYLINAFANRDSGFVILEPSTMFWALAGYLVLCHLGKLGSRTRMIQIVSVGLLFSMSVLSKEFAIFITIVPMAFVFLFRCYLTRIEAIVTAILSAIFYIVWIVIIALAGKWGPFEEQFTSGFRRTAGTAQDSGFNRPGAPSFLDALLRNVTYLGTAYAILGLGSVAIVYLAWKPRDSQQQLMAMFGLGAMPLIFYCVVFGTNEEQFFNFLLLPALICLVVFIWDKWTVLPPLLHSFLLVLVFCVVASDLGNYVRVHTTADNGTKKIDSWMAEHVPNGTVVAVTNPVQRQIFLRYTMVNDEDGAVINEDVRYLIVFYHQVDQGYAFVGRLTINRQVSSLREVFSTSDRSNGRMVVYEN